MRAYSKFLVCLGVIAANVLTSPAQACMRGMESIKATGHFKVIEGQCWAEVTVQSITEDNGMCSLRLKPGHRILVKFENPFKELNIQCQNEEVVDIEGTILQKSVEYYYIERGIYSLKDGQKIQF